MSHKTRSESHDTYRPSHLLFPLSGRLLFLRLDPLSLWLSFHLWSSGSCRSVFGNVEFLLVLVANEQLHRAGETEQIELCTLYIYIHIHIELCTLYTEQWLTSRPEACGTWKVNWPQTSLWLSRSLPSEWSERERRR